MVVQPSRNEAIEAVREPRRLVDEWFDAYNRVDAAALRELCHYPLVSFGGARLDRRALAVRTVEDPADFTPTGRDPQWSHSLIDRWGVHQPGEGKGHVVVDFRRCLADGSAYGVALSRLAICTREDGRWGVRLVSSCGLRNPARVEVDSDAAAIEAAERTVRSLVDARSTGDAAAVRELCHVPFVRFDGTTMDVVRDPAALATDQPDGSDRVRGGVRSIEVLPPQSGDKVVVDCNLAREASDGTALDPEGAVCLVTRQDGAWGVQCVSTRGGHGDVL